MTAATLRRLRREAAVSRAELAADLGVDEYTIACWETGRDPITPRRARELREALR